MVVSAPESVPIYLKNAAVQDNVVLLETSIQSSRYKGVFGEN